MTLDQQEHLQALQHVVGVGVGAQPHGDPLCHHLQHGGAAHGVAHVGFGVVDNHGSGLTKDVHLGRADVDAVAQQGL